MLQKMQMKWNSTFSPLRFYFSSFYVCNKFRNLKSIKRINISESAFARDIYRSVGPQQANTNLTIPPEVLSCLCGILAKDWEKIASILN